MKDKIEAQKLILEDIYGKIRELSQGDGPAGLLRHIPIESYVFAIGKGSHSIVKSILRKTNVQVKDGIIISHQSPDPSITSVQQFQASHPYPDADSLSASLELVDLIRKIPAGENIVFCISGGASSLFCVPAIGIEIEELAQVYELLLKSGASIHEINCVRKHLSDVKGGQLAQMMNHVNLTSIIVSDVPGDELHVIGSGPTVHDPTTFKGAFKILKRYHLWDEIPHPVRIHISKGMYEDIPDTPKPGVGEHPNHEAILSSTALTLAENVANYLKGESYNVYIADRAYNDTARAVSKEMCSQAISILSNDEPIKKPAALVYYGESTVKVAGSGKGGRNQELALTSAISIEGQHPVSLLSLATDGIDGPTDSAGVIISSQTTLSARKQGLDPEAYLQNNDSYSFFEELGAHIKIGATGYNLMDLQVILIG